MHTAGKWLLALSLSALLSACGFQPRGSSDGELAISQARVSGEGAIVSALNEQLKLLRKVGSGSGAPEIAIEREELNKRILSIDRSGRVSEYRLELQVDYRVRLEGQADAEPQRLTLRRDLSWNESDLLAKDAEELQLRQTLYQDAARVILIRTAAQYRNVQAGDAR